MTSHLARILVFTLFGLLLGGARAPAAAVPALFGLETPTGGPFPSDRFTVEDRSHNTGLRVSLPLPDCRVRPSDCADLAVINTLDGFNLQPRLSIPFDGPIDVATVTSDTVFLISLGSSIHHGKTGGKIVGINQIVWDPGRNTLHAESDQLLDQHTRYALIVTRRLHDVFGVPVQTSEEFRRFRQTVRGDYKHALLEAIQAARQVGVREEDMVVASVFTTLSATAVLEKIRDQIKAATPAPAEFRLGSEGTRTVFPRSTVTRFAFRRHIATTEPMFSESVLPIRLLGTVVGTMAFGKYGSPDYETPERFIPPLGTRTGLPVPRGTNEIYFNVFLPSGTMPPGGWPVAIFGHGNNGDKNVVGGSIFVAASMASHGIATIAINAVGHGGGPLGTLSLDTTGGRVTLPAGGRGIDQNGDGQIGANEGINAAPPQDLIRNTDGIRQTVVDLMQLVRVIEVGMDIDGDGLPDLDASRIYYFGSSLGGIYGINFLAVEPSVRAGVAHCAGGPVIEFFRLSPERRFVVETALAARVPPLINVGDTEFDENIPLRDQPAVTNTVAGAMEIQEFIENWEWVSQAGNPVAYAAHLRKNPLESMAAKSFIFQFARGDQVVPNPTSTAILRAGDLADRATFFRNDLAHAENPAVPKDPHGFLIRIGALTQLVADIARGAQEQIALFFASDGEVVIHPEPARLFEVPIIPPLPEDLGYLP
jgi:hypothetical protein